jgi:hypothetical protein
MIPLQITLNTGKTLLLNVEAIKEFFDQSGMPEEIMQTTLDSFTSVCKVIAQKSPHRAEQLMDVANIILANMEVVE